MQAVAVVLEILAVPFLTEQLFLICHLVVALQVRLLSVQVGPRSQPLEAVGGWLRQFPLTVLAEIPHCLNMQA